MAHAQGKVCDIDFLGLQKVVQVLLNPSTNPPGLITDNPRMQSFLATAWIGDHSVEIDFDPNKVIKTARFDVDMPVTPPYRIAASEYIVTSVAYDAQSNVFTAWFKNDIGQASSGVDNAGGAQTVIETAIASRSKVQYLTLNGGQIHRVKVNR